MMEFCMYCQKWIEPKKGVADLVAGVPFGIVGLAVGAAHYLAKGHRCPICNNVIKGHGARPQLPIQGVYPPQPQPQFSPAAAPVQSVIQSAPARLAPDTDWMATRYCPRCGRTMMYKHHYWHCYDCKTTTVARPPAI
jgi:hypothetical protein